jgi:hypothetical protein
MAPDQVGEQRSARVTAPTLVPVGSGVPARNRVAVVVAAMATFLVAAVLKPWGDGARPQLAPPISSPASTPSGDRAAVEHSVPATVVQSGWAAVPFVPGPEPVIPAAAVQSSLRPHPGWGIRAVVDQAPEARSTAGADLAERWTPIDPGGGVSPATNGFPIRALGVTIPAGTMAFDARVLSEVRGHERWRDVEPVGGGSPGASVLLWPPRSSGGWGTAWAPGRYRILVLTPSGVVDFGVYLPGSTASSGPADPDARIWNGSEANGGWLGLDTQLGEGAFAGVIPPDPRGGRDGPLPVVLPLAGRPGSTVDLAEVWLGRDGGAFSSTATAKAYLPRAVALGVAAPPGATIASARLIRLLPEGTAGQPTVLEDAPAVVTNIDDEPYREVVRFEAPGGRPWAPGAYAIQLSAMGPSGGRLLRYPITLLPGSARAIPAPLTAIRAWSRFAGSWGVAAGLLEPLEGPPRLAVRHAPQTPEATISGGADFSRKCLEVNLVDAAQPILGIAHPVDWVPDEIAVQRVFLDGTVATAAPSVAPSIVPGLSLVAARDGAAWSPGWYRLILSAPGPTTALPFCVGQVSGSSLLVPPQAGLHAASAGGSGS